ncbi:MAG: family 20 glycosylhydrolase, partial [Flavobacteriales bacterium]|nr:family 20 glycosylhydrolase [Flavobacteriales bacterium]
MRLLPFFIALTAQVSAQRTELPTVIPAPVEMRLMEGTCDLTCGWMVEEGPEAIARLILEETNELLEHRRIGCIAPIGIHLQLIRTDTLLPDEWYRLEVGAGGITISAPSERGLYRGSRTLAQLLEQGSEVSSLPCLTITDHPRFPWRGMHLDVVRHFFPVDFVKRYIDLLARYKMNSFHWHLTDDQGWRIEIKSRPKLTEVGAWRSGSQVGPYARLEFDTVRYGGYYTQDEIREVVAYAAARHINVV